MDPYAPTPTGIINTVLPVELVSKVWSFMTIAQLLHYAMTSSANYNDVHNGIRDSVHRVLSHFCADTNRFLGMLRTEHVCVSGSVVVHVLHGVSFKGGATVESGWFPHDADVYVPLPKEGGFQLAFVDYMIEVEGYHKTEPVVSAITPFTPDGYVSYMEVKEVVRLRKGYLKMDVILSASPFSLMPIMRFHSTLVMNCITGNGIWSAYPSRTCARQGICNPMVFTLDHIAPKLPPANVRSAFRKYARRGFDIRMGPTSWANDDHVCTKHGSCPQTFRTVEDWGCMYVSLRAIGEDTGLGSRKGSVSRDVSTEDAHVVWLLGGRACNRYGPGLRGYISWRREYTN
jgi:hypothetical protein